MRILNKSGEDTVSGHVMLTAEDAKIIHLALSLDSEYTTDDLHSSEKEWSGLDAREKLKRQFFVLCEALHKQESEKLAN